MGRGSAPQGGPGNYGGSKSAKPRKPRNVTHSFKLNKGASDQPEEAAADSSPAFTVTRPSRERRAELLRAQRIEKDAAAKLAERAAALARQPVNGTSPGGEVLGGYSVQALVPSAESLREARLQHLATQQNEQKITCTSRQIHSKASSSSSSKIGTESNPVMLSEDQRLQALQSLMSQPLVKSWQQSKIVTGDTEHAGDEDISDDELHVLVTFLLDALADRVEPCDVAKGVRLLQTVLGNATKDDPKYRKLKAGNDKLWAGLLQHPEFCMMLEAAGFQKSTEEEVRCMELNQLELDVQVLLTNSENIDEAQVEALLHQMEQLKSTPVSTIASIDHETNFHNLVGRSTTFLYHASETLLGDLAVVLDAVQEWKPLSSEEVCQ